MLTEIYPKTRVPQAMMLAGLFFDLKVPLGIPKGDACLSKKATKVEHTFTFPLEKRSVSHAARRAKCRQRSRQNTDNKLQNRLPSLSFHRLKIKD